MVRNHLVLLPGLDGTGQLFASFLAALPDSLDATTVAYPANEFLPYAELLPLVRSAVPHREPFVLLAESFSSPIAVEYAASNPRNLTGLIIVAGFVRKPAGSWSLLARMVARPWFFGLRIPRWVLEHALMGKSAPEALVQEFQQVLKAVSPGVLSGRARAALNCDVTRQLARVNVPLMYVQAAHDRLLSESCVEDFKHIRPDTSIALADGPHLLSQREPQKVADIVAAFVGQLGS